MSTASSSTPCRAAEGLTGRIIETGEPVLLNQDVGTGLHELGAAPVGELVASYLGMPVLVHGRAVGVLSVQSRHQSGRFGPAEQTLLGTLAGGVGVALRNAQVFAETRAARALAEQRAMSSASSTPCSPPWPASWTCRPSMPPSPASLCKVFPGHLVGIRRIDPDTGLMTIPFSAVTCHCARPCRSGPQASAARSCAHGAACSSTTTSKATAAAWTRPRWPPAASSRSRNCWFPCWWRIASSA